MSDHADLVEALLAENPALRGAPIIRDLLAENQRLRDALERCAVASIATPGEAQLIARAALYGTP